jgi:hypothetical protein
MKLKNIIRSFFLQESKKEFKNINSLEQKILLRVKEEKELEDNLNKSFTPATRPFWNFLEIKVPYAFAVFVLVIFIIGFTTSSVLAKGSVIEMLVNLRNALQQELSNILNNDPSYRDKGTQKYQQAQKEWCLVSARPAEEREKAVEAIRDFLDRPDANVEYECVRNPSKDSSERPQTESYIVDLDRFTVDTKTNVIIEMSPKEGTWGINKDGSRWFSSQKEYDYTPRYTDETVEQFAVNFIKNHESSLGKIDLDKLTLEVNSKDENGEKITYFLSWKNDKHSLTISFTQGGQLVAFLNELGK